MIMIVNPNKRWCRKEMLLRILLPRWFLANTKLQVLFSIVRYSTGPANQLTNTPLHRGIEPIRNMTMKFA